MPRPLVIALSGKRFTGKDTLADALETHARALGVPVVRAAFATECKRAFVEDEATQGRTIDLSRLLTDRAYKEATRPALTAFTERSLAKNPLVFLELALQRIGAGPGLLTDLRLRSELLELRERTELLAVRIERPLAHREASGFVYLPTTDEHRTETGLDHESDWTHRLTNDASLDAWQAHGLSLAQALQRRVLASRSAT